MAFEQVALISQTNKISLNQLSVVSAALQKQVTRDFRPYWDVEATVDAFGDLHDVPIGYWQIIIRDDIPYDAAGIHLNQDNGQPYALVRYSDNWSLTVSHECLEMLADPYGRRIAAGNSIKKGQGRVEYLVEVCDPSEAPQFGYTVNGVLMSDFYTTRFFDPVQAPGVRYSFTGAIGKPHEVLDGGYISWRDPVTTHVWQLFVEKGKRTFIDRGPLPDGFGTSMRLFTDMHSNEFRARAMEGTQRPKQATMFTAAAAPQAVAAPSLVDQSVRANAERLMKQISGVISASPAMTEAKLMVKKGAQAASKDKKQAVAPAET